MGIEVPPFQVQHTIPQISEISLSPSVAQQCFIPWAFSGKLLVMVANLFKGEQLQNKPHSLHGQYIRIYHSELCTLTCFHEYELGLSQLEQDQSSSLPTAF